MVDRKIPPLNHVGLGLDHGLLFRIHCWTSGPRFMTSKEIAVRIPGYLFYGLVL